MSERAVDSIWVAGREAETEEEAEKKRKAKLAEVEIAMQVTRTREMKRMVVIGFCGGDDNERRSVVSKDRRAVDGFRGSNSSSWFD